MRHGLTLMLVLATVWAFGEPPTAVKPLDANSSVNDVLDALHGRGQNLKDFTADVSLTISDALGAEKTSLGRVWFQRKANNDARIRVAFTEKRLSGRPMKQRLEYLLDNGSLIDQNYETKLQVTRQVLRPGQKLDPLKLGEGPFPLPIGQPPADVLKMFDVKKIPAAKDDPAGTVHVQLKPREGTRFARKYESIDVFVSQQTNFPVRIDALERGGTDNVTDLSNIQINTNLKDSDFQLPPPGKDWGVRDEELSD